jgi:hypothetical protein
MRSIGQKNHVMDNEKWWVQSQYPPDPSIAIGGLIEVMFNHIHNFTKRPSAKHNVLLMRVVRVFTPLSRI